MKKLITPDPVGVWPLYDEIYPMENKNQLLTKGFNIGYDPTHPALDFPASAIFSGKWMPGKSYFEVQKGLETSDITIMAWVYIDKDQIRNKSTLLDFRTDNDSSLLSLFFLNGRLQVEIPSDNEIVTLSSPGMRYFHHCNYFSSVKVD